MKRRENTDYLRPICIDGNDVSNRWEREQVRPIDRKMSLQYEPDDPKERGIVSGGQGRVQRPIHQFGTLVLHIQGTLG